MGSSPFGVTVGDGPTEVTAIISVTFGGARATISSVDPAARRPAPDEDLRLAGACVAGDRAAQRGLFAREKRRVHATLYRILGSNQDMEDLVQEAFFEVFRSLGSYRGEAILATWIDRVTARVAYAYLTRERGRRTARLELVPEVADGRPSLEQRALAREAARELYALLDRIEPNQRIAFTLHVIDGRPLREVAAIQEASLVATKVRVWRARREVERRAARHPVLAAFLGTRGASAPSEEGGEP